MLSLMIACPIKKISGPDPYVFQYEVCDGSGATFQQSRGANIPAQYFGCSVESPIYCIPAVSGLAQGAQVDDLAVGTDGTPSQLDHSGQFYTDYTERVIASDGDQYELGVFRKRHSNGTMLVPFARKVPSQKAENLRTVEISENAEGLKCLRDSFCQFLIAKDLDGTCG